MSGVEWTFAMTNLVACIPRDEEGGKATEPDEDSIQACKPRLEQFIRICKPKLLVCVGALARDWFKSGYKHSVQLNWKRTKVIDIIHPAAIIRANVTQQGLAMQRCWVTIANAIDNLRE